MARSGQNNNTRQKVEIYGEKILITSKASPSYISRVAQYVNANLEKLGDRFDDLPRNKVFILGLMNMAGEIIRLKEDNDKLVEENSRLKKNNTELKTELKDLNSRYSKLKREFEELYNLLGEGG